MDSCCIRLLIVNIKQQQLHSLIFNLESYLVFTDNIGNVSHSPSQTSLSSMDGTSMQRRKSKERKESKSSTGNNKKGTRRRITKDDIGKPENFQ